MIIHSDQGVQYASHQYRRIRSRSYPGNIVVASESEERFLGNHDENGFLEVALVNTKYKLVQRHQSMFSFLHFLLILTYQEE